MAWQRINLEIPKSLKPDERIKLADLVIEHIVDRTQRGIDKNGVGFPKYSKSYINSLDFKNAGKKPGKVDLTLSGDMLASLKLLNHSNGKLLIGFENNTIENDKAEGNILGSYGKAPNPAKARDFLGIQEAKLSELVSYIKSSSEADNGEEG